MWKIKIQQTYKSIPNGLEWNDIPNFAIITGKNGSGKSQLLEQIKVQKNWVDISCSDKYIKYIPAIYLNNATSPSRSAIIDANNNHKKNILNSLKPLFSPDTKQYIKNHKIDLLHLIDMMSKYDDQLNTIQKKYPREYLLLTQDNLKLYHIIAPIRDNNLDCVTIFKSILTKAGKTLIEDITEEEFLANFPPDMNNDFTSIVHLIKWFTIYIDDYDKKVGKLIEKEIMRKIKGFKRKNHHGI